MKQFLTILLMVLSVTVFAQPKSITGKVTDKDRSPIPGATVVVKGTTTGSVTNLQGQFTIEVDGENTILVFSFVGMETQEINVEGMNTVDVILESSAIGLEEVVAVGYGTRKKVNVTGAVSTLTAKDMVKSPSANVISSLAGQVSGLVINTRTGQPGAENTEMFIRGKATMSGSNSPLVLIDGVGGDLARLNPDDIESISVLKDASAAIYGVNASNGVILVTTKRGQRGVAKVTAKATYSLSQPTFDLDWTDNYQTALAINEYNQNKGNAPVYSQQDLDHWKNGTDPVGHPNQDWYDLTYKDWAPQQRYSTTMSGGTEKLNYFVSADFLDQDSQYKKGDAVYYKQYQIRSNIDVQATKRLKLSFDVWGILKDRSQERFGANHTSLEGKGSLPEIMVQYDNGLPGPFQKGKNPIIMGSKEVGYNATYGDNYQGIFRYDYQMDFITDGLYTSGWLKYGASHAKQSWWENSWNVYSYDASSDQYLPIAGGASDTDPWLEKRFTETFSRSMHAKLGYIKEFGYHKIDAFVAIEAGDSRWEQLYAYRGDYATNALETINAGDEATDSNAGYATESGSVNYFGRLNYGYKGKYLLDFTYRVDGSYKYAPGYRFGYFPGVSAAWRISEEAFFQDNISFINYLKLRASWGQMGNNTADPFQYLATYSATGAKDLKAYLGEAGQAVTSYYISTYPNIALTWEIQTTTDIGLDLQLANGLVDLTADYFYSKRKQIAITRAASLPDYYGIPLPEENLGIVNSWGVDASLGLNKQVNRNVFFSVLGTFTYARNRVEYLDEAAGVEEWQRKEGHSVDVILGQEDYGSFDQSYNTRLLYVADGLFQNQAEIDAYPHLPGTEPGDIRYIDYDGDGEISLKDRVRYDKSATPEIVFGLSLSGRYKNFDMTARFQGQARAWRFVQPYALRTDVEFFENRWQKEGDNQYPRVYYTTGTSANGGDVNDRRSTFWLQSAAFARLKTLELGYEIPARAYTRLGIENMRVFVNGENLFVIDGIKISRDPELANWGEYPILRIISGGLSFNF